MQTDTTEKKPCASIYSKCIRSLKFQKWKEKKTSKKLKMDWSITSWVQICIRKQQCWICMPLYTINFYNYLFINTDTYTERAYVKTAGIFRLQKCDRLMACWESNGLICLGRKKISTAGIYPWFGCTLVRNPDWQKWKFK